jgi:nucleoside-diphosphate-sugar epimerase
MPTNLYGPSDNFDLTSSHVRPWEAPEHDISKPNGTPRRLMSNDKLAAMGRSPRISLESGLSSTYQSFLANKTA